MKARRGRPKGSTNREITEHVCFIPPRCPHCGETGKSKQIDGSKVIVRKCAGIKEGKPHTHIAWRRMMCACGGVFQLREYQHKK